MQINDKRLPNLLNLIKEMEAKHKKMKKWIEKYLLSSEIYKYKLKIPNFNFKDKAN